MCSNYIKPKEVKEPIMDEKEVLRKIAEGDKEANEYFLERNFPIIENLAKKFAISEDMVDDLIQEGYLGYAKALEKYDPSYDNSFITYAYPYITKFIREAVEINSTGISLKRRNLEDSLRYKKICNKHRDISGKEADISEIAKEMKVSEKTIQNIRNFQIYTDFLSMEIAVKNSKNGAKTTLKDTIEDPNGDLEENIIKKQMQTDLISILEESSLKERQKEMLYLYYCEGVSSYKIGEKYGMTGAGVRDTNRRSLRKIREMEQARALGEYIGISYSEDNLKEKGPVMQKTR